MKERSDIKNKHKQSKNSFLRSKHFMETYAKRFANKYENSIKHDQVDKEVKEFLSKFPTIDRCDFGLRIREILIHNKQVRESLSA